MSIFEKETKRLGFGLMRLPLTDPNDESKIDIEALKEMVDVFMARGFTYFDTAIMYSAMKSQNAMKEVLVDRYPRESFSVATKLHYGFFKDEQDRDLVFEKQLKDCGVEYFDYYLLHDMSAESYNKYSQYNCFNWLSQKKNEGKIRHIGFSYHDRPEFLDKLLNEHPEIEFVQLQINYLDWESPAIQSKKCYEVCVKHEKPVIVMEPVRGGTLANVPAGVEKLFKDYNKDASAASWALRFVGSLPEVKIVLSGMSNMEQMLDNTEIFGNFNPFDDKENEIVFKAVKLIKEGMSIYCTGCSYCTEGCPMKIAIPKYFSLYNIDKAQNRKDWTPQKMYFGRLAQVYGKPSECIGCGQCEAICPQHLPIIEYMKDVAEYFEK